MPDLFQEGLIVEEQALGGAYTGPQQRTILSIQGPKVITERQRGANTYADTSLLNSGHYLGNDGSAPWIPSPVLRALLTDGIALFNTTRNQEGVMLELVGRVIYPAADRWRVGRPARAGGVLQPGRLLCRARTIPGILTSWSSLVAPRLTITTATSKRL